MDLFVPLIIVISIFIIWLAVLTILYIFAVRHYKKLTVENGQSLEKAINTIFKGLETLHDEITKVDDRVSSVELEKTNFVQKVGIKRFNPFGDTGGNQSFSLTLLDANNDGVVLSSLHGRGGTRIYAKPIRSAKSQEYELSQEEKDVISLVTKG